MGVFCALFDNTREAKMGFKKILPYFFAAGSLIVAPKVGGFQNTGDSLHAKQVTRVVMPTPQEKIQKKAKELCDLYISNVLQGQKNIKQGNKNYRKSVKIELPGAPVGLHCVYGQYVQLTRALEDLGDTLTLIPRDASRACPTFRTEMRKKYSGDEYSGAIYNGKMFKSDAAYNRALAEFLKHHNVTEETPDSVKSKWIEKFEKNNFSVDALHPGAILVIQKNSNPNNTHAVMFVGRGHVKNGEFIPDVNGKAIYAGFNNESVGDIFTSYSTDRIFAADIYQIAAVSYTKEYEQVQGMTNEQLYDYIGEQNGQLAKNKSREELLKAANAKYFKENLQVPIVPNPHNGVFAASMSPIPNLFSVIQSKKKTNN